MKKKFRITDRCRLRAFYLPALILLCAYFILGVSPFGRLSFFSLDLASQYVHFYSALHDAFRGGSLIYSWSRTLGGEFLGIVAYYLASPFCLIVILLPKSMINTSVALMLLLKTGTCGLTMYHYLDKTGRSHGAGTLTFSVMYALSAYVVVYGSNIMWLDGVYMLPLIAYGLERLVGEGKVFAYTAALAYSLFTNYYIGYMLCIFSVMYFFFLWVSREKATNEAGIGEKTVGKNVTGEKTNGDGTSEKTAELTVHGENDPDGHASREKKPNGAGFAEKKPNGDIGGKNKPKSDATLEKNPGINFFRTCMRFALGSIVAGMAASAMLFPAYRSLSFGKSEFSSPEFTLDFIKDFLVTLSKLFPCAYDKVDYNGSAYIYCGVLALMLAPLYLTLKSVPRRRKIALGVLAFVFGASLSLSIPDLVWHGFQYPNWLDFRFAFMVTFLLCAVSAETWEKRSEISGGAFLSVSFMLFLLLAVLQVAGPESFGTLETLGLSVVCIGVYLAVICGMRGKKYVPYVSVVLCAIVCTELLISSAVCLDKYSADVGFLRAGRVEENTEKYSRSAKEISKTDPGLYRTEIYGSRLGNDPFSIGIKGLTSSTSTVNTGVISLLGGLGYLSYSNYTKYIEVEPAADSLLGVKYIISEKEIDNGIHVKTDINVTEGVSVYENKYALPVAFLADAGIADFEPEGVSSFEAVNGLYSALLGEKTNVFSPVRLRGIGWTGVIPEDEDGMTFYMPAGDMENTVTFTLMTEPGQYLYCRFPSEYRGAFDVCIGDEKKGTLNGRDTYTVLYLGRATGGETAVTLRWDEGEISMYKDTSWFYSLDTEALASVCERLARGGLEVERHTDTRIKGTLGAEKDGTVFTSIPFDSDFTVYVDGKKTDTFRVAGALLAFDIIEGRHDVEIVFGARSLIWGAIVGVFGVSGVTCIYLFENKKNALCRVFRKKKYGKVISGQNEGGAA